MDEQRQVDQLEPTYNNSVPIQDVAWKTYWERWTIEIAERHDDDDDDDAIIIERCNWLNCYRRGKLTQQPKQGKQGF